MYYALFASILVELMLYTRPIWRMRRIGAAYLIIYLTVISGVWTVFEPLMFTYVVAVLSLGRIINLLRIVADRFDEPFLRSRARQTSVVVSLVQLLFTAFMVLGYTQIPGSWAVPFAVGMIVVAAALLVIASRNIQYARYLPNKVFFADRELPSISICIPARNENGSLEECIRFVLSSNYPKLEIIVLDDSSQDNTPDIIKSFAHDGVRFVHGDAPSRDWLPKNWAYHRLAQEASGEYIVFSSVDIRFTPESIRRIITAMLSSSLDMVSIVPQRYSDSYGGALVQPMRYWWEFVLPRRFFNRPPVLSSCWVIKRKELERAGGFAAVKKSIIPEAHFARYIGSRAKYKFLRSDIYLGVQTQKTLAAQRRTLIRLRYPQIHQRLELTYGLAIAEALFLLGPFVMSAYAYFMGYQLIFLLSGTAAALLTILHVRIISVTSPPSVLVGLVGLPIAVITEVYLSVLSALTYEFSTISWKGRRINPKQLEIIPHLPLLRPQDRYPVQKL